MSNSLFSTLGFSLMETVIGEPQRNALKKHIFETYFENHNEIILGDPQVPTAPAKYADSATEELLSEVVPLVEETARCKVWPTYSYFRLYRDGDCLPLHRDRPACEISLTLTVDYNACRSWPLLLRTDKEEYSVEIPRGSGLLYKGFELFHRRERFVGAWALQVFLHYVDQRGPFSHLRYDGRDGLGLPKAVSRAQGDLLYKPQDQS